MMPLEKERQAWEELANLDPYWAILSDPKKKFGHWDVVEFLRTGDREITWVMESATHLGYPLQRDSALDFGCGLGRLTRALAKYFQQCYGVDVSEGMISQARDLHRSVPNCTFVTNAAAHLGIFSDDSFDLIYTNIVLQHLPKQMIRSYLAEFVRILRGNGLLLFQLPSFMPLWKRVQIRRRLYALLRALHVSEKLLYEGLRLCPIRMNSMPRRQVLTALDALGAKVLQIQADPLADPQFQSLFYYVTK